MASFSARPITTWPRSSWLPVRPRRRHLIAGLVLGLAGCGDKPPPPPPPTIVNLQLSATGSANQTPDGKGAPVNVRVYQLGSAAAFDGAEFFPLFRTDKTTLGTDLVKKDEYLLTPDAPVKSASISPMEPVKVIGVFAAYRDFQKVAWRATAEVPAHKTTTMTITADRDGVKLVATPGKPASP